MLNPHTYISDPEILMCCRAGGRVRSDQEAHGDSCIFAGHKRHYERDELPAAMKKYHMFLFDDSSTYIQTFVMPMFTGYKTR
jgi:hypothetical protein